MEDFWLIVTPRRVNISRKSSAPPTRVPADELVRDIRRATRKHHSAEGNIRIVMEGLGSEESIENIRK
jgi:transposase